jgi:serine/threonine protein kinase
LLYAYALSSHHHRGHYLLYDLAEKGSLDAFWNSDLGRERLSSFAQRAQIAIDAFIGLRFLHVGNKHISPSFHGDVKSANIVLKRDFTAQLIDCGLGAFATVIPQQDITSASLRGTRGYACPKYCAGALSFDESCDIFSFGVVLAELWSGSLQNRVDATGRVRNFFDEYTDADEPRGMEDDLDKALGIDSDAELPSYMEQFRDLALACMSPDPTKRPDGHRVLNCLERIWQSCNPHDNLDMDDDAWSLNKSLQSISDSSGTDDSVCQICRSFAVEVGYDECPLCLALHVQRVVKAKAVPRELDAKYTAPAVKKYKSFRSEARSLYDFQEEKSSDPLLPIRDLRLNHSLPRLFVLLPADDTVRELLPSMWLRSTVPMRMNLYFVCQDTLELLEPPVPMSVSRVWISRIALLLGVSLTLLKQSRSRGMPHAFDGTTVDQVELSEMLNAVHHLLQDDNNADDLDTLQRVKSSATLSDADVESLNGPSYELVAERARQDVGWRGALHQFASCLTWRYHGSQQGWRRIQKTITKLLMCKV